MLAQANLDLIPGHDAANRTRRQMREPFRQSGTVVQQRPHSGRDRCDLGRKRYMTGAVFRPKSLNAKNLMTGAVL